MILTFLTYVLIVILGIVLLVLIIDLTIRSKGYKGPVSDHFNGIKFLNIHDTPFKERSLSFVRILRWMLTRKKNVWQDRTVLQTKPVERVHGKELVATFINHASVLIQTEGLNILTDPIYSKRASPFSFVGPRRYTAPGIAFEDLPAIDAILISHNHYDHLDNATLQRLVARDNPRIIVPLGNTVFLNSKRINGSIELDWWQSSELDNAVTITCVPAQHFSARALSDRNKTLWSGYVISTPNGDIYFAGDTGLGPFVDQIAERFPKGFRLGFLPIGAFRPQWFMKEVHISPDEAFAIRKKLNIQDVVAIHFGTFNLADDTQDEPVHQVHEILTQTDDTRSFATLRNGESIHI